MTAPERVFLSSCRHYQLRVSSGGNSCVPCLNAAKDLVRLRPFRGREQAELDTVV